jgi:hypothetical protein
MSKPFPNEFNQRTRKTVEEAFEERVRDIDRNYHRDVIGRGYLFYISNGYLWGGREWMKPNDEVWMANDCSMPILLRKVEGNGAMLGPASCWG